MYDVLTSKCYFEYVEKIINRLTEEHKDESWRSQVTVTVRIPKKNILDDASISSIHNVLTNRFEAHDILIKKEGHRYKIPSFLSENESDFKEPDPAQLIKKYGLILLNDHDILSLYQLLTKIPFQESIASKELLLSACVVYSEMGKSIEADFYLNKANQQINQFSQEEKEILKFTQIKVDFLLGRRNKDAYYEDLKSLQEVIKNPLNELQLKINLFYYSILEQITNNKFDEQLEHQMIEIFALIDKAGLSERKKHLFRIYHAASVHMYISSWMLTTVSNFRLREALVNNISNEEREHAFFKSNSLISLLSKIVITALKFAREKGDILVEAHSNYALSRFFFSKEYDFLILNFKDNNSELANNYKKAFLQSIQAHNLFFQLGLLTDARLALINAFEINRLAKLWHDLDVTSETTKEDILLQNLSASQVEMGISNPHVSIVDKTYKELVEKLNQSDVERYKDLTDDQVESISKKILETYKLPKDRLINIASEIKSYRFFYQECDIDRFELLCDLQHHNFYEAKYLFPTKYIIISKSTGLRSLPSTDVRQLANSFGAIK